MSNWPLNQEQLSQLIRYTSCSGGDNGADSAKPEHKWKVVPVSCQDGIDITTWTGADVQLWLDQLGCGGDGCKEAFAKNHITGPILLMLTEQILLDEMGVKSFGQRKLILLARDWLAERLHRNIEGHAKPEFSSSRTVIPQNPAIRDANPILLPNVDVSQANAGAVIKLAPDGNLGDSHLQLLFGGIITAFSVFLSGFVLLCILPKANPWFLLWVSFPLFHFWLNYIQKATHT